MSPLKFSNAPPIPRAYWIAAVAVLAATAAIELAMGRPPICTCGTVRLWTGAVHGAENSQQVADWYSLSHVIHGFLFYWIGWLVLSRNPPGDRLLAAILTEAGWELLENSPIVIARYRHATAALGYSGDSILNSVSDICFMLLGFALARRLPVWATVALAIFFELLALAIIRDNLTLNVLMLVAPNDMIRNWQGGV
ncbi:MAG TPA: DUF2585 domain-containing protein [Allosphingosinicella sp.]|nr:DUF2585 domain-containing protein [Allosphingosinicella sp.]